MNGPTRRILILGVGNEYRRDDAAGLEVARRVARHTSPGVEVREVSGEGASLMDAWQAHDEVFLADAVRALDSPGKVHFIEAHSDPVPTDFLRYSTHAFGVAEAIELARSLGTLPSALHLYGIEGERFDMGQGLSVPVENAVEHTATSILNVLKGVHDA